MNAPSDSITPNDCGAAGKADSPFVGLRPYRAGEGFLIFGRTRDAQLLFNKIYSSPLTLLYAPSGVGKTSLLTGLVIPRLRCGTVDDAAEVVYFEQWESADPLSELKQAIAKLHPGGDPDLPLSSVLNAAQEARHRAVVLILDQFEQFLIRHPDRVDAFGSELGQAIKLAKRCHVVLSLREEFLAGLQPFRRQIATLMASTFRLEYLAGDAAREAIAGPIGTFDARIDRALVDALLADLQAETHDCVDLTALPQPGGIELPFLQLVCQRLWESSDKRLLTLALYRERLGGRDGIINSYVQGVVAGFSESEKDQVVEILRRLAPRSGIKKLYLVDELCSEARLPDATVCRQLNHLEQHKVLRTRRTSAGTGYELYHDAFIKVLRPWIEERVSTKEVWLRRRRHVRNVIVAMSVASVLMVLVVQLQRDSELVKEPIVRLKKMSPEIQGAEAPKAWTEVAAYLWGKKDDQRLVQLLRDNQALVPRSFMDDPIVAEMLPEAGVAEQTLRQRESGSDVAKANPGTLVISVHPDRPLNVLNLFQAWRIGVVGSLARNGLPVSTRIEVVRDSNQSESHVSFSRATDDATAEEGRQLSGLEVPERDDWIIVRDEDLKRDLRTEQVLNSLNGKRENDKPEKLRLDRWGEQGWYVPRWTAPLWKAAGVRALPPEFEIAMAFHERIRFYPELVLEQKIVDFLLKHEKSRFCYSVVEAEAVRGGPEQLRQDLIEIARQGYPLHGLSNLLDRLAAFPADKFDAVAVAAAIKHDTTGIPALAERPHVRADIDSCRSPAPKDVVRPSGLGLRTALLPLAYPDIRLRLSRFAPAEIKKLDSERLFRDLRRQIYFERGVMLPPVHIDVVAPSEVGFREMQILLPGEAPQSGEKRTLIEGDDVPKQLVAAVAERVRRWLPQMMSAQAVDAALEEPPSGGMPAHLRDKYSITDLKLILRAVLGSAEAGPMPPERTVAQLPWLVGSLIYWTDDVCSPRDRDCLVERLRQTQAGRLARSGAASVRAEASDPDVREGVAALIRGQIPHALERFRKARTKDARSADASFIALWAEQARYIQGRQITAAGPEKERCRTYAADSAPSRLEVLSLKATLDIEDHLAGVQPGKSAEDPLRLHLCLLRAAIAEGDRGSDAEARWQALQKAAGNPDTWSPDARFNAGYLLMLGVKAHQLPHEQAKKATQLLASSLASLKNGPREAASDLLVGVCQSEAGKQAWCQNALREVQARVPHGVELSPKLAIMLSGSKGSGDDANTAMRLREHAEPVLLSLDAAEARRLNAGALYGRAPMPITD